MLGFDHNTGSPFARVFLGLVLKVEELDQVQVAAQGSLTRSTTPLPSPSLGQVPRPLMSFGIPIRVSPQ
jgi:hypothetical protein